MPTKYRIRIKPPPLSKTKLKKKELLAQGLRWVCFVMPIETWNKFLVICHDEKPSTILKRLIEKEVETQTPSQSL